MYDEVESCVSAPRMVIFFAVPPMSGRKEYDQKEVEQLGEGLNALWAAAEAGEMPSPKQGSTSFLDSSGLEHGQPTRPHVVVSAAGMLICFVFVK